MNHNNLEVHLRGFDRRLVPGSVDEVDVPLPCFDHFIETGTGQQNEVEGDWPEI